MHDPVITVACAKLFWPGLLKSLEACFDNKAPYIYVVTVLRIRIVRIVVFAVLVLKSHLSVSTCFDYGLCIRFGFSENLSQSTRVK